MFGVGVFMAIRAWRGYKEPMRRASMTTSRARLEQRITLLQGRLEVARATKPAHETTGAHASMLLEIEDELFEQRQALIECNAASERASD
jgi:hypothetical protein